MSEFDIILDKSNQNLSQVPSSLFDMYSLKMLYLQGNALEYLPDEFFLKLHKLTWLDLRNNHLKAIPETIAYHQNLENLLLSDNRLEMLPNELGLVPKLTVLQVGNNPLVYPNRKIIAQGTEAICNYLKQQYEKDNPEEGEEEEEEEEEAEEGSDVEEIEEKLEVKLPIKNVSSLSVKALSKPDEKIVHKISKGTSKISLKSYYDSELCVKTGTQTSNQDLVAKESLRHQWIGKLKVLLDEQERILQQERNLRALDTWRTEAKAKPHRKVSEDEIGPAPYGTYDEYSTMLSREEIIQEIDRFMKNRRQPAPKPNPEKLINDLLTQLKEFDRSNAPERSPRSEMEDSSHQILKMIEIHRKILDLQEKSL